MPGLVSTKEFIPNALDKTFRLRPIAGLIGKRLFLIILIERDGFVPEFLPGPLEPVPVLFRSLLVPPLRVAVLVLEIPGLGIPMAALETPVVLLPVLRETGLAVTLPLVVRAVLGLPLLGMPVLRVLVPLGVALAGVRGMVLGLGWPGGRVHGAGRRLFLGRRKAEP